MPNGWVCDDEKSNCMIQLATCNAFRAKQWRSAELTVEAKMKEEESTENSNGTFLSQNAI